MFKKFAAPLIFGILFLAVMSAYLFIFVETFKTPLVIVLYALAVVALVAAMVVTLRNRYKEIKETDEEELKKY